MPRNSEETKRRIFAAATREFARHGIAGARVDRIAQAAGSNKQLIYAYFGKKQRLFDAVVSEHVARFLDEVAFEADYLATYGGATFDFYVAHPEVAQLGAWHALEPGQSHHRLPVIEEAIRARVREVRRAQRAGTIASAVTPDELLALVNAIAVAWAVPTPEREPERGVTSRTRAKRRAAVVEAIRRLVETG
jgi:AcrR family transcriptional regulator